MAIDMTRCTNLRKLLRRDLSTRHNVAFNKIVTSKWLTNLSENIYNREHCTQLSTVGKRVLVADCAGMKLVQLFRKKMIERRSGQLVARRRTTEVSPRLGHDLTSGVEQRQWTG